MAKTCGYSETSLRLARLGRLTGTRGITEGVCHLLLCSITATHRFTAGRKSFQYLTPRLRITPRDLLDTSLCRPANLHFICSPTRAAVIMSQVAEVGGWSPISVYEPIPVCMHGLPIIRYRCADGACLSHLTGQMRSGGAPRAPRCIAAHLRSEVPSSPDPFPINHAF
jgi:hypothetical protein